MAYRITENDFSADEFIRLFASAGWGEVPYDLTEASLSGSYAVFAARTADGKAVGMVRLLGDGGMAFFLKDLVVETEYQGNGIGKALLIHAENYIRSQLKSGWTGYLQLVSAKGKESFYEKMGYSVHPNDHSGPAFSKWIG